MSQVKLISPGPCHSLMLQLHLSSAMLMLQNRGIRIHQYLDDWLLHAASVEICLKQSKQLVTFIQELGNKLQEIRAKAYSKIRLPGVRVRLKQGRGLTHRKEMADLDKSHRTVTNQLDYYTQKYNVFHRDSGMRPFQWYLKPIGNTPNL